MSGVKWLYISKENKIFKVPNPKEWRFKAIKGLSNQDVLQIMLYYETKNRKPYKLEFIEFNRITLDSDGVYELTDELQNKVMQNEFQFIYNTPQDLADNQAPFQLPLAPSLPTVNEKTALYEYLDEKFPNLGKDAPLIVENKIHSLKNKHQSNINMLKEASKLRRNSGK